MLPKCVTKGAAVAAKRLANHHLLEGIRDACSNKIDQKYYRLATMWGWPHPEDVHCCASFVSGSTGADLPCQGYPFVVFNLRRLLAENSPKGNVEEKLRTESEKEQKTRLSMLVEGLGQVDGVMRRYRMRITVSRVDENTLDGGDGGGAPLDCDTIFSTKASKESRQKISNAVQSIKRVTERECWDRSVALAYKTKSFKHAIV